MGKGFFLTSGTWVSMSLHISPSKAKIYTKVLKYQKKKYIDSNVKTLTHNTAQQHYNHSNVIQTLAMPNYNLITNNIKLAEKLQKP